jgi:hypothetical protein
MISDEQLIDRLRVSMSAAAAEVAPPEGLLDGIAPARGPRLGLAKASGWIVVLTSASALAITVLAIALLGHARTPTTQTTAPQAAGPPAATGLAGLRSELAILRRPQRPADRIPGWGIAAEEQPHCSNCLNVTRVLKAQTRLLASLSVPRSYTDVGPGPERVYLVLGTVPASWENGIASGWRQRGRAGRGLHLSLVGVATRHPRIAQPPDELLNYVQLPMPSELLSPRDVMITSFGSVGVVPDGVTRVKWELTNPGQAKPVVVYPRVHGNTAIAPMTPAPRSTALIDEQFVVGATWFGPDGRVLASFHDNLAQFNRGYTK